MKKVVLLTTGGTIASRANKESGKLASGAITGEELASMCNLPNDIEVVVESVFQKASIHITFDDLLLLKDKIENYFNEASKMNCRNVKLNIGEYYNISTKNASDINLLCDKYSIKLTIENDQTKDNGKVQKIKDFLQLSEKYGMKLSSTFDIGNWLWQKEDPVENANILKPYVTFIHLKDVIVADKPQAVFLDEGLIPWRSILGMFDKKIPVAIEYPCTPDTLPRLKEEIDKLINAN
jgi:sugar phosphate isomerase/epimerase